jgi:hypothetical protein
MRRFAWEFLCRNAAFIHACDALTKEATKEELASIALEFGLKRFKHYKEAYGSGKKPRFRNSETSVFTDIKKGGSEHRYPRVSIRPGEVLVRFDLNYCLESPQSFAAQLRSTERRLSYYLRLLTDRAPKTRAVNRRLKRGQTPLIDLLQTLDAKAAGATNAEIAREVFPALTRGIRSDDALCAGVLKPRLEDAKEYAATRYLQLPVLRTRAKRRPPS